MDGVNRWNGCGGEALRSAAKETSRVQRHKEVSRREQQRAMKGALKLDASHFY